jgi:hypothetical protein
VIVIFSKVDDPDEKKRAEAGEAEIRRHCHAVHCFSKPSLKDVQFNVGILVWIDNRLRALSTLTLIIIFVSMKGHQCSSRHGPDHGSDEKAGHGGFTWSKAGVANPGSALLS